MSSLIVEVSQVESVQPHPNADRLEIAQVKGWETIVPKGEYSKGDTVVYVPVDAILPPDLSDQLGVTQYLSKQRVRAARLRGFVSYGFIFRQDALGDRLTHFQIGDDVGEILEITKWEPSEHYATDSGKRFPEHPLFHRYTHIENIKNFPGVFFEDEEVVITEKIHGTNWRVGMIQGDEGNQLVAGSHKTQRDGDEGGLYWDHVTDEIRDLLVGAQRLFPAARSIIAYGEIFGPGSGQDLHYGHTATSFRLFDLSVNGVYLSYKVFDQLCRDYEVSTVPVLYKGPFSMAMINDLTTGNTMVDPVDQMREGVVVKPTIERRHARLGRVILKSISAEYLLRKEATEYH
jgi:RNA ligase (TIGR02306 family)